MLVLFGTPPRQRFEDALTLAHIKNMLQTPKSKVDELIPSWYTLDEYNTAVIAEAPATQNTYLHFVCANTSDNQTSLIRVLTKHYGMDVNAKGNDGLTPLAMACLTTQLQAVSQLLSNPKTDVNIKFQIRFAFMEGDLRTDHPVTILFICVLQGNLDAVKILMALRGTELELGTLLEFCMYDDDVLVDWQRIYSYMVSLIQTFHANPARTSAQLRHELGVCVAHVAGLFALIVFVTDKYLIMVSTQPKDDEEKHDDETESPEPEPTFEREGSKELWVPSSSSLKVDAEVLERCTRFFNMAIRLPMELQMILCLRAFDINGVIIPLADRECAFERLIINESV